jgi:hypothetical protein
MFSDLSAALRAELLRDADEHDITVSSFTKAGTFTYDRQLVAFSFRFEVRELSDGDRSPEDIAAAATATAQALAIAYLDERGIASKRVRANAVDMADMWR